MKKPLIVVAVVIALLAIIALVLVVDPTPSSGMIQDKRYEAAETETKCKTVNGKRKCRTENDPAVCEFLLVDGKRMGWREVPCGTYDSMTVGQFYRP